MMALFNPIPWWVKSKQNILIIYDIGSTVKDKVQNTFRVITKRYGKVSAAEVRLILFRKNVTTHHVSVHMYRNDAL